ncbi:MAG: hypothetical protein MR030_08925 [Bacteroidales bacterium]|nr:hypothetical protein [Bacteroidales bacterium]
MDELSIFCQTIKSKLDNEESLNINQAREIVKSISIKWQTEGSSAYSKQEEGGGGLMA